MAKKWCGFSIQNELIKNKWDQLLTMQEQPPEPVVLETCDLQPAVDEDAAEPVPVKTGKGS